MFLGKDYPAYDPTQYFDYLRRRFEPEFIVPNSLREITRQIYPDTSQTLSLVEQMVEKGKRLFLMSKFLPQKEEYQLIGYTKMQLKDCYENEKTIWDLFIQNNLLQNNDNEIVSHYIGESPATKELGTTAPGNIGAFTGWQIVKKYMNENSKTLKELMEADPEIIFEKAKYKP